MFNEGIKMKRKVLILRNFASEVNIDSYNLQEIGMGKAFVKRGMDCDVVYYNNKENFQETIYTFKGSSLTVKWTKGIKFMSNSIYYSLLSKKKLNKYDIVISTEYNQIMTLLLTLLCGEKVYLYHGPYRDNNNKFIQRLYDIIAVPIIKNKVAKVTTKSNLAKEYLKKKGFDYIETVGVGLDIDRFNTPTNSNDSVPYNKSLKNKNLLYVGVLEDRRNIEFLLRTFAKLVKTHPGYTLNIVGSGARQDVARYLYLAKDLNVVNRINYITKLKQNELRSLYERCDLFLFPTSYDIFGMVLLESMYFSLPVISTLNGGSDSLIDDYNGLILNELDESLWVHHIEEIINSENKGKEMGRRANRTITEKFTWGNVVKAIIS